MDYLVEAVALGVDVVILSICVNKYFKSRRAVNLMQDTPCLELNKELKATVFASPLNKLEYVAVRGNVKAIGNPIVSNNNPKVEGVIQLLSIKEHIIRRTSTGFWTDQERVIQELHNVMPFVVEANNVDVEIIDPLAAEILDLDIIADNFQPTTPSLMDHVIGFFSGIRQRGIQTTEKMLRRGVTITGIGELVGNKDGTLRLQPPVNGAPFYLTNLQINSLIRKLEDKKKNYRVLCFMFGAIGVIISGILVRRYWKEWRRRLEGSTSTNQVRRGKRSRAPTDNLPDNQLCVVCKTNPLEIILLPCGHVCLCEDCADVINDHCPLCRATIAHKSAAYLV